MELVKTEIASAVRVFPRSSSNPSNMETLRFDELMQGVYPISICRRIGLSQPLQTAGNFLPYSLNGNDTRVGEAAR